MQSIDGLAFIGRNPLDSDNVYVVTGDSGNGMTYATIAAILITDLIEGRPNPLGDALRSVPEVAASGPGLHQRGCTNGAAVRGLDQAGDVKSEDDIPPDAGAVLNEGLAKVAVYREPDGTLHRLSAVCVHLGCVVRWNPTARTWDCPCHGSRYDRFGAVIDGPANADLPPR
jgi:Rieske Fe-S protein